LRPQTHIAIALGASKLFEDPIAQATVIATSIIPDIPNIIQWGADKIRRKKPFGGERKYHRVFNEIFHLIPLWMLALYCYYPLWLGIMAHLTVDLLSHRERDTSPCLLWPLPFVNGLFDYRYGKWAKTICWMENGIFSVFVFLNFVF